MTRLFRALLAIAFVLAVLFSTASAAGESSNDQSLFALLYDKITEIVTPRFDPTSLPTEVVLLEMPGLAINREEYDEAVWKARNYASRQPEAVAATFVDRLPAYTGVTFVDSGSRISTVWRHFMYQYIVPVIDDPAQVARVEAAKTALFNSTMQADFARNLDEYETELNAFENKREDCLSKKNAGFCSVGGVIWRERLRRKWFKMEVSRRTVADAESRVLALQVGDLKVLMAEALENFASSERVDMGADGFGSTYYSTQLSPSNFWRWWPAASSTYDYKVLGGQTSTLNSTSPTASASSVTIVTQPSFGIITFNTATNAFAYTPQPSFTGSDTFSFSYNTSAPVTTVIVTKSILVQGGDVNVADSAFVGVSATQSASQSSRSSSYEKLTVDAKASFNYGMVKVSGSYKQSQFKSSSSFSSSGQQSSLAFELAKVRIIRPWLDTSLLSFYPIGIRGLRAGDWSDGTIKPAKQYEFKFKLLPTAFLVARNIKIQNSDWSQTKDAVQSSLDISASLQVSVGPFFSGSASTSYSTSKSDYRESATFDSNTLAIQGPQVIGWVCTPIPRFPNSDEDAVRKWEKDHATLSVTATKV